MSSAGGYPPWLFAFVIATIVVSAPAVVAALYAVVQSRPSASELVGVGVLFSLAFLAELRPVPVDVEGDRLVSLAFVFVISAQMIFGWDWSVLVGAAAIAVALLVQHVAPLKILFNGGVYALAALIAAAPYQLLTGESASTLSYMELTVLVFVAGLLFVIANVALVCGAISLASSASFRAVLADHFRHSGPAFMIMGFIAAQTVIFWNVSPFLVILVSAPLFTLNLYQRSSVRGRVALVAAATDSLTGLKNHRAFQDDLAEAVEDATLGGDPVVLCLIDVDRFKQVNDLCGHPAGDAVLRRLAELMRAEASRAYRLGGDEFALMFRASTEEAVDAVTRIKDELARGVEDVPERCTISGGVAVLPGDADDPASLKAHADLALYLSKRSGRDRVNVYEVGSPGAELLPDLGLLSSQDARLRLAEKLIVVVEARDAYVGEHATAVASLVVAIGRNLGIAERDLRHLHAAGLLHDLGKIGIPDAVLRKEGPLNDAEEALMRTHTQIGFDLLDGLDLSPVDTWILHHHEHFDGNGYPFGLAGRDIPLGSRIILAADAFNAMTTDRSYRKAISEAEALAELDAKAGTQFDPDVVAALARHLAPNTASMLAA